MIFSCSADHAQDWQSYPVDPYSCYMCDHTSSHVGELLYTGTHPCQTARRTLHTIMRKRRWYKNTRKKRHLIFGSEKKSKEKRTHKVVKSLRVAGGAHPCSIYGWSHIQQEYGSTG